MRRQSARTWARKGPWFLFRAAVVCGLSVLLTAQTASAAFLSSATNAANEITADSLTGLKAPATGVASFDATRARPGAPCVASWGAVDSQLSNRAQLEVLNGSNGSVGSAGPGAISNQSLTDNNVTTAAASYTLQSRVGSTWKSASGLNRTATCPGDNNAFAQATVIPEPGAGTKSATYYYDLSSATIETGEVSWGGPQSAWWRWTPTATYAVGLIVDSFGSGNIKHCVTTVISSCSVGTSNNAGTYTYNVTSGTTYYIRMTTDLTDRGSFQLFRPGLANDALTGATPIAELATNSTISPIEVDMSTATSESGEVSWGIGQSLWWSYTPTSSYSVSLVAAGTSNLIKSCFTTVLGSCSLGSSNNALVQTYALTSGTTYYIRITPDLDWRGWFVLYRGTPTSGSAPANDNFASATSIAELAAGTATLTTSIDLGNAGVESGELNLGTAKSAWWKYTATSSQTVDVYIGGVGSNLAACVTTLLTSCTEGSASSGTRTAYNLSAGVTYYIRITPNTATFGAFSLRRQDGGNDAFVGATALTELAAGTQSDLLTFDAANATIEPGEVVNGLAASRWWKYVPTSNYVINVQTSTGNSLCVTTVISSCSIGTSGVVALTANTTYYIRMTTQSYSHTAFVVSRAGADNDLFANATAVAEVAAGSSTPGMTVDVTNATVEIGEVSSNTPRSRWWKYTPSSSYVVNVYAAAIGGNSVGMCVTTAIGSCSVTSNPAAISMTSGVTYYVRVSQSGQTDSVLSLTRSRNDNDLFAGATVIAEPAPGLYSSEQTYDLSNATVEPGELSAGSGRSQWWSYTATSNYTINIDLGGLTGSPNVCVTTAFGSCTGGAAASQVIKAAVTSGTTYYIRLAQWTSTQGKFYIQRSNTNNDQFANATTIPELANNASSAVDHFDLDFATVEANEVGAGSARSLWWSYTPTGSYSITVNTSTVMGAVQQCMTTVITSCSVAAATTSSAATYALTSGTTYYLRISPNQGNDGALYVTRGTFTSAFTPPNDNMVSATAVGELAPGASSGYLDLDVTNATAEGGEVTLGLARSVWWKYTPTSSYSLNAVNPSFSSNTTLCVTTSLASCTVTSQAASSGASPTVVSLTAGTTYYFRLTANSSNFGGLVLERPDTGGNDIASNASTVAEVSAGANSPMTTFDVSTATMDAGETGSWRMRTLWWKYTPSTSYAVDFFAGTIGSGNPVFCVSTNTTSCTAGQGVSPSHLVVNMTAGTTYYLRMSNDTGTRGLLQIRRASGNDLFANATPIPEVAPGQMNAPAPFDAIGASAESGEAATVIVPSTVWFSYSPTIDQTINLSPAGWISGTIRSCLTTTLGSCSENNGSGPYVYNLTANTTYYIRIEPDLTTNGWLVLYR